jgi:hypothetical protein
MTRWRMTMPEHPIPRVRDALIPGSLVSLRVFRSGPGDDTLDNQIEEWVQTTGSLIVMPGPVSEQGDTLFLPVTYVPASRKSHDPTKAPTEDRGAVIPVVLKEPAKPVVKVVIPPATDDTVSDCFLSDGGLP